MLDGVLNSLKHATVSTKVFKLNGGLLRAEPPAPATKGGFRCFNDCMQAGICFRGICHCTAAKPRRSYDCSAPIEGSAPSQPNVLDPSGFIYVHHPSPSLGLLGLHQNYRYDDYAAEYLWTQRLMADWKVRTLHRERARLFYVPTWAVYATANHALLRNRGHWEALVSGLLRDPDFNQSWAANESAHVFFFGGDWGSCSVRRGPIYLSHFGLTVP